MIQKRINKIYKKLEKSKKCSLCKKVNMREFVKKLQVVTANQKSRIQPSLI